MKKPLFFLLFHFWFVTGIVAQSEDSEQYPALPSNYFFTNASYSLKQGEGYYANTWLFFNDFYYGITDHISAGVGFIPLFLFNGAPTPFWLKGKVAYPVVPDKFAVSGGFIVSSVFSKNTRGALIQGFIGFTLGPPDRNFSMNYYPTGITDGKLLVFGTSGLLTFSGRHRISPRSYVIGEYATFLISNDEILELVSGGLGNIGLQTAFKGLILDYGLAIPFIKDKNFFLALPYLGVKIPL